MDLEEFWELIHRTKRSDTEEQLNALTLELSKLSGSEIIDFERIKHGLLTASYSINLWGAAYIINGGCSDDSFDYFRGWLIAQGKAVFGSAVESPDSLAKYPGLEEEVEFEEFWYVASTVYEKRTGKQIPDSTYAGIKYPDLGEDWDFDDESEMRIRYPELCEKFPNIINPDRTVGDSFSRTRPQKKSRISTFIRYLLLAWGVPIAIVIAVRMFTPVPDQSSADFSRQSFTPRRIWISEHGGTRGSDYFELRVENPEGEIFYLRDPDRQPVAQLLDKLPEDREISILYSSDPKIKNVIMEITERTKSTLTIILPFEGVMNEYGSRRRHVYLIAAIWCGLANLASYALWKTDPYTPPPDQ